MSDPTFDPERGPAMPLIQRAAAPVTSRLSAVWIVPLLALVISLGIAWKSYSDRGTLIDITFDSASGLEPGQSVLKYRDVEVGIVETVGFTESLDRVLVSVRVDKEVMPFVDGEARFWIVQPKIGFSGISGLDTVLSGVFIEGLWDEEVTGEPLERYAGLAQAPLLREEGSGTWVTLSVADGGALIDGAPVLFRGIKVGELRNLRLSGDGAAVLMDAFIEAPYDSQLTTASVFWDTSGFSVSLDTSGIKLNVRSISSLVQGGVEFNTLVTGGEPIVPEQVYQLYDNETLARDSVFADTSTLRVSLSILLDGSVRGLKVGDSVTYRGLKVGEVGNLAVQSNAVATGGRSASQRIDFDVSPERMGFPPDISEEDFLNFIAGEVAEGLRARVISTGMFGGGLEVELRPIAETPVAEMNLAAEPHPVVPSVAPRVADISETAEGLLTRVNSLPIEEVMTSAIDFLDQLTLLVAQDDTQAIPEAAISLINEFRNKLAEVDVATASNSLETALAGAEKFITDLNAAGTVESITGAMTGAREAADAVYEAVDEVPQLVETLNGLSTQLSALPFDQVVSDARAFVGSLNALISTPEMAAVPEALASALGSFGDILRDVNEAGTVESITSAMTGARAAADAVSAAVVEVPQLVETLNGLSTRLGELPFDLVVADARAFMGSLNGLISTPEMAALPEALTTALGHFGDILRELNEAGVAAKLNETMTGVQAAVADVAGATERFPQVLEGIESAVANANRVITAYGEDSGFNNDLRALMRTLRDTAGAFEALARTIERNPQSLLLGR